MKLHKDTEVFEELSQLVELTKNNEKWYTALSKNIEEFLSEK